jgi:Na+/melibiose symporter-like transporter
MALLFSGTAFIGFAPNSFQIIIGARANPPYLIHVHAATMALWLLLVTAQAMLAATRRQCYHEKLGMTVVVAAPCIVILMTVLAWPSLSDPLGEPDVFLIQMKRLVGFSACVLWAFCLRKKDPESHKRLVFVATFAVLDAAFFRMIPFLPTFGIGSVATAGHAYQLLLLVPLIAYDLGKLGRIHGVYVVTLPIILSLEVAAAILA